MKRISVSWLAIVILSVGVVTAGGDDIIQRAEPGSRLLEVDDYFAIRRVGAPQVSPDGEWVALTVRTTDLEQDASETRVWMVPLAGGEPILMTAEGSSASDPRWSPDGKYLSFLSGRRDGTWQVWALDRRGGEARQLTDVEQGVEAYEWSPDGTRLVLVMRDSKGDGRKNGNDEHKAPAPWVIDRLQFKYDGVGYLDRRRTHLYLFEPERGQVRQLTFGDFDDSSPAWSPDGRFIAFVSNRTAEPDANSNTDLWLVASDGPEPQPKLIQVTTGEGTDQAPVWHPQGGRLAFITTLRPDIPYYAQTEVAMVEVGDAEPTILTDELDRMVDNPRFSPDGDTVYFTVEDRGAVVLDAVSVDGGAITGVITGHRRVENSAVAPDGTVVALISETDLPGEIFVVDPIGRATAPDGLRQLTHVNAEALAGIRFPAVEKITATSYDGSVIEAFVYKPPDFEEGRRYPTILWIHGGPQLQYDWGWDFEPQLYAANGYLVVLPNPRGSTGYGQEFCLAIWQQWGNVDRKDVLAPVDRAIELGWADPARLGVGGWSWGGSLTNYVITNTDRFKAAISGAGSALYVANYGHDHYQRWYEAELGLPWETRELWERLSPYNRVQHITTPTLWTCGEKDWNVPVVNSEMMYQAMRRLGRETLLVVYPGQDHGVDKPSYVKFMYEQWIGWYDRYLKD
jgi:dipeptidyl aminopeptidase/acylaminoacyl peptidase